MSKQANKTVIGIFVVIAVALAVAAVVVLGSGKFFAQRVAHVAFFTGSVKGLRIGAPVAFRGVKIGTVTDIRVKFIGKDLSFWIPVLFEIEPDRFSGLREEMKVAKTGKLAPLLIEHGLRAQLQMQSLVTGQLFINLDFHPDKPAVLVADKIPGYAQKYQEMPTIPTSMQEFEKALENLPLSEIIEDVRSSLAGIERVVNNPEIEKTLHYLKQLLRDTRDLVRHVDSKVDPLASAMEETVRDMQRLVNDVDRQVAPMAASVEKTSQTARAALNDARKLIQNADGRIEPIGPRLTAALESAQAALKQAESTLATFEEFTDENSQFRYRIFLALEELSATARSFRALADYLEQNPDALLRGKTKTGGQ